MLGTRNGFTLLELMMAMLIVAIIGVLVISPVSYLAHIREKAAANKIKADIRYAQSYALTSQQDTWVSFSPALGTYSLYYQNSPGSWSPLRDPLTQGKFTVNITGNPYSGVVLNQTNFNGFNNGLVFDDAGIPYSANSSGFSVIPLASQGSIGLGGGTTVTVEPNTGLVH